MARRATFAIFAESTAIRSDLSFGLRGLPLFLLSFLLFVGILVAAVVVFLIGFAGVHFDENVARREDRRNSKTAHSLHTNPTNAASVSKRRRAA